MDYKAINEIAARHRENLLSIVHDFTELADKAMRLDKDSETVNFACEKAVELLAEIQEIRDFIEAGNKIYDEEKERLVNGEKPERYKIHHSSSSLGAWLGSHIYNTREDAENDKGCGPKCSVVPESEWAKYVN